MHLWGKNRVFQATCSNGSLYLFIAPYFTRHFILAHSDTIGELAQKGRS